jgi:hypothetical protein
MLLSNSCAELSGRCDRRCQKLTASLMLVEEPAYERRPYWNGFGGIDQEMTVASKRREHPKFRFPACSTERSPFLRASLSSGMGC